VLETKGTVSEEIIDPHLGIPLFVTVSPITDEKGDFVQCLHTAKDLTERKKSDKIVLESQRKFQGLFEGNPEATVYLGTDFHVQDINPKFKELFGYSLEEVKGKHINDVIVPNGKMEEAQAMDDQAIKGYASFDALRKRKDGSLVPVSVSGAPVAFEDQLLGYVAMYKDISQLKKTEAAMKEMMQKMVLTNEKLRVVGGLTRHDVRNKLSAVTGNAFLLKRQLAGDPGSLEKLADMQKAVQQVTQIFDFAKAYESLGVEELVYVDLGKIVNEAVAMFPDLKDVEITNTCSGLTVLADSLLRQMFFNLIHNSLKHGQKTSKIKIHCEEAGSDELKLYYEDDGVGIPEKIKANLFKEGFTTGNGSGYGLYLIKNIMEVYGWKIRETGTLEKGAQFTITIPRMNQNGKENYSHTLPSAIKQPEPK
jgi:PAS domain S-box-containing protein